MADQHFIGGWRQDIEEQRMAHLMSMASSPQALQEALGADFEMPDEIDPRPWSKVRSQGQEGSCQGHMLAAEGEFCAYVASGKFQPFSPDYAYYETQRHDGLLGHDQGSTIAGGIWVAKNLGFLPEANMPYTDAYNPNQIPKNANDVAAAFKVASVGFFDKWEDVCRWIGKGLGAAGDGILWTIQPDGNGDVKSYRAARNAGGHATAYLGYGGPKDSDGMPAFLWKKNSWGTGWGLNGWARVYRSAWEQIVGYQYNVCAGVSDMSQLQPRKHPWAAW